jgi:amidase
MSSKDPSKKDSCLQPKLQQYKTSADKTETQFIASMQNAYCPFNQHLPHLLCLTDLSQAPKKVKLHAIKRVVKPDAGKSCEENKLTRKIRKTPHNELSLLNNCTLGPMNKPIATVKPGETVTIETWDALGNVVKPGQTLKDVIEKGIQIYENPITGPIYVEGAEPGDTLQIDVLNIELPETGETSITRRFGALEGWLQRSEPHTKFSKIENGNVIYVLNDGRKIAFKAEPFIGTIGVSPLTETISTTTPGKHGGNMDVPDVCRGNTLYLPVAVEGALLGLGDVHAAQGDGEICGTAVEVNANVTLRINLFKGKSLDWPRIESKEEIMTVCSAKPLEDAARLAFLELIKWLGADYGIELYDAYMLLSLTAKARIAQIVDPLYTVVAKFPKRLLPSQ